MRRIRITEVGPRDGLQNEKAVVPVAAKIAFVEDLAAAGCTEIEVTSFVPPKWVPQLADGAEVLRSITRKPGVTYSALVPNERGLEGALACGVDAVAVFAAVSEGFSRRNTNGSIDEVFTRLAPVIQAAKAAGVRVRGYLSCVIACPFDGPIAPSAVARGSARLLDLGVDELDLGDTIGAGTPESIEAMYDAVATVVEPSATVLHLHDTRGAALGCVERALALGVRAFDASATGLGGCPYAPGHPGTWPPNRWCARSTPLDGRPASMPMLWPEPALRFERPSARLRLPDNRFWTRPAPSGPPQVSLSFGARRFRMSRKPPDRGPRRSWASARQERMESRMSQFTPPPPPTFKRTVGAKGKSFIDYKQVEELRRAMTPNGKLYGRKRLALDAQAQKQLALAVKRARFMALLPYTNAGT